MNGTIITGAPRSGKSTCIERLLNEEKGYAVVSGDSITVSLYYTENGKRKFSFGRKKTYDIFEKTVNEYQKIKVILDYHYIEIEKLLEYLKNNYKIIFFGYPNISSERLKQRIRRNENQNDCIFNIDIKKKEQQICSFLDFPFRLFLGGNPQVKCSNVIPPPFVDQKICTTSFRNVIQI